MQQLKNGDILLDFNTMLVSVKSFPRPIPRFHHYYFNTMLVSVKSIPNIITPYT